MISRFKIIIGGFISVMALAGCVRMVEIMPQAVGGSKADGVVELGYQYGKYQQPNINWELARETALSRCKAWKYKNVEKFGGHRTSCLSPGPYGCNLVSVTVPYQCTN